MPQSGGGGGWRISRDGGGKNRPDRDELFRLLDLAPPESYRIEGSGQGGAAGFARGGAAVTLTEDGAATVLSYRVKAEVGGKIAQLGARLIDASAKQMADQFFDNFGRAVALLETTDGPAPEAPAAFDAMPAMPRQLLGFPLIAWIAAAAFAFIAYNLLASYL